MSQGALAYDTAHSPWKVGDCPLEGGHESYAPRAELVDPAFGRLHSVPGRLPCGRAHVKEVLPVCWGERFNSEKQPQ